MTDEAVLPANSTPAAPASPGGVGRAALVVALVLVAFTLVVQVVVVALPWITSDYPTIALFLTITMAVGAILAVIAVILGAIGVQPRQMRGRFAAAAAVAIGATHLLSIVVGLVAPEVLGLLL